MQHHDDVLPECLGDDLCSLGHIVDSNGRRELPRGGSGLVWRELGLDQEAAAEVVHPIRVPPGRPSSGNVQLGGEPAAVRSVKPVEVLVPQQIN